ncbi:MAG TPA: DUF2071 domain-containing protein [Ohtaekwangia sp.]|nr:DUF2071 domain-containing protein [Ohtaekwangia sp.]
MAKPFLTACWTNLLIANFIVDKKILEPYRPAHTELDAWNGNHYMSLVGFLFTDTCVRGIRFPFHITFEEVNLRFYVRFKANGVWKRGVVFIKELVPRRMITYIANTLYHEHYETREMSHAFRQEHDSLHVAYHWKVNGKTDFLQAEAALAKQPIAEGSEAEFITEHYWGFTMVNAAKTSAYEVQHPRWNIHPLKSFSFQCQAETLYGASFAEYLADPSSVFMADGSPISVMPKQTIS